MSHSSQKILFVDDEVSLLDGLRRVLRNGTLDWEVHFVVGGLAALESIEQTEFDAIVTDIRMPGMTGFELLGAIRDNPQTQDIPVIILTGENDLDLKRYALDLGASDLLNKPVGTADLIARLNSVLRIKSYQDQIKAQNQSLEARVEERTQALMSSRQEILWRLAKAGEYRDEDTGYHVVRVARYCQILGEALGLDGTFIEQLTMTSPLHDIGKIGIPDSILHKPGKLTPDEWATMQTHCEIGERILREDYSLHLLITTPVAGTANPGNPMLDMAATIALNHHEKWNGTGYPRKLSGEEIPLAARIVALADVYDALSSVRPYKRAFEESEVLAIIAEGVGQHFDPTVHAGLAKSTTAFRAIRMEYPDGDVNRWKEAA